MMLWEVLLVWSRKSVITNARNEQYKGSNVWYSQDRASWYILIIKANKMH